MIKIVDKRCDNCGKVYQDVIEDEAKICDCGGDLKRIYSLRKEMQMLPHWNEHLGHEPVYIESYQQFKKEVKKRGLYTVPLKKPKKRQYFF